MFDFFKKKVIPTGQYSRLRGALLVIKVRILAGQNATPPLGIEPRSPVSSPYAKLHFYPIFSVSKAEITHQNKHANLRL